MQHINDKFPTINSKYGVVGRTWLLAPYGQRRAYLSASIRDSKHTHIHVDSKQAFPMEQPIICHTSIPSTTDLFRSQFHKIEFNSGSRTESMLSPLNRIHSFH